MRALLWILAGVVVLDVALVAIIAICAAVVRRRGPRAIRDPVTWWPMEPEHQAGGRQHGTVVVPIRTGGVATASPAADEQRRPGRRTIVVALVAASVFAGTAFASPQVRRFVATAIGTVTGHSRTEAVGEDDRQPAADDPTDRPGAAGAAGSSPSPDGSTVPSPGPAVEPRPPGVPHDGVLVPGSPSNLTALATSSSEVDLAWTDVDGESGFRVERSSDGAGGWNPVTDTGPGTTTWSDVGLSPGTTYFYRVAATNLAGDSPPSNVASATTSVDPASPTTVTAVASSSTQIDLVWTDVANETGYRLERSDGSGGWTTVATTGQDVTSSSDTGLTPGTTYSYRVFATNAAGDSAASDVVSATTQQDPGSEGEGPPSSPGTPDRAAATASPPLRVE